MALPLPLRQHVMTLIPGRAPPVRPPAAQYQLLTLIWTCSSLFKKQMVYTPFLLLLALVSGLAPPGVNPAARHQMNLLFRRSAVADVSFANVTLANV